MLDFQKACEVLHISVNRPRMVYAVEGDVAVDGVSIDQEQTTQPAWRLMPESMSKELNKVAYAIEKYLGTVSVSFKGSYALDGAVREVGVPGIYIVPRTRLTEIADELREFGGQLRDVVRRYALDTGSFHDLIKAKVGAAVFDKVKDKIPCCEKLLRGTGVQVISLPVQTDLAAVSAINNGTIESELQRETAFAISAIVDNVVAQPRKELADALQHLESLVKGETGVFSTRALTAVGTAFQKLKTFDFAMDPELLLKADALSKQLGDYAQRPLAERKLNGTAITAAISQLRGELTDASKVSEHVQFAGRRIRPMANRKNVENANATAG